MNILAIGAHPDDIEFLCAGTLALYAKEGHNIYIAVATNGNVGSPTLGKKEISKIRKNECVESCKIINAKLIWMDFDDEWLYDTPSSRLVFIDAIREAKADIVFIHNKNDYHPDHRNAGMIAEDSKIPVSVKLVKSTHNHLKNIPHFFYMDSIGGSGFEPEHYVDIASVIDIKIQMIECHKSQNDWLMELFNDTPSNMMKKQSSFRGYLPGYKYAEGFKQVLTYPLVGSYKSLP
jgi:LmbE family N-acetylglucosaminyl deacetylase